MPEALSRRQAGALYDRLDKAFPHPEFEHPPSNDYQALVAILMSAQSTAIGVERATSPLFAKITTPRQMVALGEPALRDSIKTLGLFRTKAKHVIALSQLLLDRHDGQVPRGRDALLALPGVGPKTADVVLNALFGEPAIGVDTHVLRVCNRTWLAPGKNADAVAAVLKKVTPARHAVRAHAWLFTLGREICTARLPECWHCPVQTLCRYERKVLQPPAKRAR